MQPVDYQRHREILDEGGGLKTNIPMERKAWGWVRHVFSSDTIGISLLDVERGGYSSKHLHRDRHNRFIVHTGGIDVVRYDREGRETGRQTLFSGDSVEVPAGEVHRFEVLSSGHIAEVYTSRDGSRVRIDDIERLDTGGKL